MSGQIIENARKGQAHTMEISQHLPGDHSNDKKFHELPFFNTIAPISQPNTTLLTTPGSEVQFWIQPQPHLYLVDDRSIFIRFRCQETGGVNSITPTFAEMFIRAIQWYQDGQPLGPEIKPQQIVLDTAMRTDWDRYSAMCNNIGINGRRVGGNLLNHDTGLNHRSVVPIPPSGQKWFWVPLINPFKKDGYWLGAMKNVRLTVKITFNDSRDSGSGILSIPGTDGVALDMICRQINIQDGFVAQQYADDAVQSYVKDFAYLHEAPSLITPTETGTSPLVQLTSWKDKRISYWAFLPHVDRGNTNTAYWNLLDWNQGVAGISEVQRITRTGTYDAGTVSLFFRGEVSIPLLPGATLADLKAAFEAIPNVRRDGITVTFSGALTAATVDVTFNNPKGPITDLVTVISAGNANASGVGAVFVTTIQTPGRLPESGYAQIVDVRRQNIFSNNEGIPRSFESFIIDPVHFGSSRIHLESRVNFQFAFDDFQQKVFFPNHDHGQYIFTGDESLKIENWGNTTQFFPDLVGWQHEYIRQEANGKIVFLY